MLTASCTAVRAIPQKMRTAPDERHQHQWLPVRVRIVLHPARRSHQAQRVQRHEGQVEPDEPAPEDRLAERSLSLKPNALGNQ